MSLCTWTETGCVKNAMKIMQKQNNTKQQEIQIPTTFRGASINDICTLGEEGG